MDVKMTAGSPTTSGGGVANYTGNHPGVSGFIAFPPTVPIETVFQIPAKKHSFQLLRQGSNIFLRVDGLEGTYGGNELLQLLHDLEDVVYNADRALDEQLQEETNTDDEDELDENDDDSPADSDEVPPPPAVRAQADGDVLGIEVDTLPLTTFCECADCRRKRI